MILFVFLYKGVKQMDDKFKIETDEPMINI